MGLKVDIAELTACSVRKDQNTQKAEKRTVTSVLLKEGWGGGGGDGVVNLNQIIDQKCGSCLQRINNTHTFCFIFLFLFFFEI